MFTRTHKNTLVKFLISILILAIFPNSVWSEEEKKELLINGTQLDERFTHFVLKKGEKIQFIEPFTSLYDAIRCQTENFQYQDYRNAKFTALELLHPLAVIVNKTAPKGTEVLAESIVKKIDNNNSIINEVLLTATEFFKAMEPRAPIAPPTPGQVVAQGIETIVTKAAQSTMIQYSDVVQAKLEQAFKEVYDKYKLDLNKGAIEQVRQALFEKTLEALNQYMASYYDPEEYVFKGLILGSHAKGDLLKYMDNIAKKVIPPFINENGHLKGSAGAILHSPRKVTTVSAFNTNEVVKTQTVFTVTPAFWFSARLKQSQNQSIPSQTKSEDKAETKTNPTLNTNPPSSPEQQNPSGITSPNDALYWTAGSIWGERQIDISTLDSYEGIFFEVNLFVMGFTVNVNQTFFFKEISQAANPSASAVTFSIEHNGFKKTRREELKQGLGKFKVVPNIGYVNVFPIKNYSIDISTL
jgi:hypothetical protein